MLCSFQGPPRILRLHGRGDVLLPGEPAYDELLAEADFEDASLPEARRAIVRVEITRIADACGYGVPPWPTRASASTRRCGRPRSCASAASPR